ncbi:nickel insertion protein, partial [Fibrobacterota bacterium]
MLYLDIKAFYTTPFTFGTGEIPTSHGVLPVPAPAVLELTKGFPVRRTNVQAELCTPTGAAIITTLVKQAEPLPPSHRVVETGYGAGTRNLEGIPNILRVSKLEPLNSDAEIRPSEEIYQVECNFDDMSPETLGFLFEKLFLAGCRDAWQE